MENDIRKGYGFVVPISSPSRSMHSHTQTHIQQAQKDWWMLRNRPKINIMLQILIAAAIILAVCNLQDKQTKLLQLANCLFQGIHLFPLPSNMLLHTFAIHFANILGASERPKVAQGKQQETMMG